MRLERLCEDSPKPPASAVWRFQLQGRLKLKDLTAKAGGVSLCGARFVGRSKLKDHAAEAGGVSYEGRLVFMLGGSSKDHAAPLHHGPKRLRYSVELIKAFTISAFAKLPLN